MSRTSALILFSILIILTPLSGLPVAFRALLTIVFGVVILMISFSLRASEVHADETRLNV
ncbi:MAG TPA: hypothetical protein VMV38_01520 [Candidatus Paceibacterota bacterium]|nr:hypothetical protein [Candidatus Paceibacterota bacterium]